MSAPTLKLVSSAAADGLPPVKDAKSGLAAVLHILMKHMSDCMHLVLDSVVEKYGLDKEEVMAVITENPRWKEMYVNPIIHDLGYVLPGSELAVASPEAVLEAAPPPAEEVAATPAPPAQENVCPEIEDTANLLKEIDEVLAAPAKPATPQKKRVRVTKKVVAAPPPIVEAAPPVVEAPKEEPGTCRLCRRDMNHDAGHMNCFFRGIDQGRWDSDASWTADCRAYYKEMMATPAEPVVAPAEPVAVPAEPVAAPAEPTPATPPAVSAKKKIVVKRVKKSELGATAALSTSE